MSKIDELLKDLQNDTINFTINLISDESKTITFRPIKTKDQKILTIEKDEVENTTELKNFHAVLKLVDSLLIKSPVPLGDIKIPDFLWLLINIRAKSIGETIDLIGTCEKCKEKINLHLDLLNDCIITKPKKDIKKDIKLSEKITLMLDMINVEDMNEIMSNKFEDRQKVTIASTIKKVDYDGEVLDILPKEKIAIVDELPKMQLDKLSNFSNDISYGVKISKKYECKKCNHNGEYNFEAHEIISFF